MSAVPGEWEALSPHQLREGQREALAALAAGGNVLKRSATGSGKTLIHVLPTAARWRAGMRRRRQLEAAGAPPAMPPRDGALPGGAGGGSFRTTQLARSSLLTRSSRLVVARGVVRCGDIEPAGASLITRPRPIYA